MLGRAKRWRGKPRRGTGGHFCTSLKAPHVVPTVLAIGKSHVTTLPMYVCDMLTHAYTTT